MSRSNLRIKGQFYFQGPNRLSDFNFRSWPLNDFEIIKGESLIVIRR